MPQLIGATRSGEGRAHDSGAGLSCPASFDERNGLHVRIAEED